MTYQASETRGGAEQRLLSIVGQLEGRSSELRERTSEWGRLLKAATGWPWQPEQWVSLSAVLLASIIGFWLMLVQVGSGDYGQWLMVSRAYVGQDVPTYRDISTVPPITPMGLAFVNLLTSSPIAALQIFKGILAFSFVISVYLTGKSIFRSPAAGLLSTVIAFLVADRMLELFAFGGLPQITAMIFMVGSVGLAARASRHAGIEWKWWAASASMMAFAAASHVGTGMIAVFMLMVIVAGALAIHREWSWRARAVVVAPFLVVGVGLLAYYIPVLLPANESYASNPASQAYRGPDRIWAAYGLYLPNWVVIATGSIFILVAVYKSYVARRIEDSYLSILWAVGAWGFLFLTILSGSSTDYPRFTAPLLIPMAVAAGGGLALMLQPVRQILRYRYQKAALAGIPIFAALTLVIAVGFNTASQHNDEASFYALTDMDSVRDISTWLQDDNTEGHSVVAPTREGKWIEGLSGSAALINIPGRFSFRESELERSIANETMLRSVSSLVNEQFFVKFIDAKEGAAGLVPVSAWIGANHGGEYVDMLRQPTSSTRVFTGNGTDDLLATLGALSAIDVTAEEGSESRKVTTMWMGARRGEQVNFTRTYEIESGGPHFTVTDTASSELSISGLETEVLPVPGVKVESIVINDTGALITFPTLGSTKPKIQVTSDDAAVEFSLSEKGLMATSQTPALSLTYTVVNPGQGLHRLDYLTPELLIKRFDIGYVVLENNNSTSARADRLAGSGFFPVYFSGPYAVLGLEGPFLTSFPEQSEGTEPTNPGEGTPNVALPTSTPVLSGAPSEPGEPTATPAPGSTATPSPTPTQIPEPTSTPTPAPPPPEMIQVALWAYEYGISAADVLVSAREDDGEWLTELTEATTLSLGVISSSDDPEKVRQRIVTEALLRSYTTLVNENYSLKFIDSKNSGDMTVPRQLWAAGNSSGEYEALLRILPTESRVISNTGDPTDLLATLNSLAPTDVTVINNDDEVRITTLWMGERRGGTVEYRRTVILKSGSDNFEIIDHVSGTAPIGAIEMIVRPPTGASYLSVETDEFGATAELETTGGNPLVFDVTSGDSGTVFESRDGGIAVISSTPNRLHMRIAMPVLGEAITDLQSLVPADVVEEMDIRAIFLRRDDAFSAREKRMNSLGFTTVAEFGSLVVMTREVSE